MGKEYQPTRRLNDAPEPRSSPSNNLGGPSSGMQTRTERLDLSGQPPVLAWFAILDGPHTGAIFRLNPETTTFGRDGVGCDVVLDDSAISRQHFRVRIKKEEKDHVEYILTDLDSENKTLVNDTVVHQATLNDGDRVKVGRITLVFKRV